MVKLYGGARSRATLVRWYLEELGLPYEFVLLDMAAGEHRQPEFLAKNPTGKVPLLEEEDGWTLWESGAILLYLAEKHGQIGSDLRDRSRINQWILFANSTLATGLFVESSRDREMPKLLGPLNDLLGQHPFILGDVFSVVDVAVGSILAYVPMMLPNVDLSPYPQVMGYIQRLSQRPAFQTAMGQRS